MERNKKYIVGVILTILVLFIAFWTYVRFKTMTETNTVHKHEPYKPFAIVVQETTWNGNTEGIKIVNQPDNE
jgi:predicted RND superfamily exporter protein